MENVSLRIIFDQKSKTKKNPKLKAMIHIEVRDKNTNKKTYIPTDVKILDEQYTTDGSIINSKHPNSAILRKKVQSVYNRIEAFVLSEKCEKFEDVANWNKGEDETTINIVDFINADLRRRDVSLTVIEYNNSFIKRLEEYGKMITFKDITYNRIEEFDTLLRKYIKSSPTLYKRHSLFKGYIEKAMRKGLADNNPYDDFQLKKGKSKDPVYLIESEVKKIMDYQPKGLTKDSIERVRDLFVFQCFTGLAYTDLKDFREDKIVTINNEEQIRGTRMKTGVPYVILLLPQAKAILEKYDYELPIISNQKYNQYLGTLIERVEIDKEVSTHTARHTFATYLINKGVSIEAIPKIMGHTDMKQSLLYARMLGSTAINEMKDKLL